MTATKLSILSTIAGTTIKGLHVDNTFVCELKYITTRISRNDLVFINNEAYVISYIEHKAQFVIFSLL